MHRSKYYPPPFSTDRCRRSFREQTPADPSAYGKPRRRDSPDAAPFADAWSEPCRFQGSALLGMEHSAVEVEGACLRSSRAATYREWSAKSDSRRTLPSGCCPAPKVPFVLHHSSPRAGKYCRKRRGCHKNELNVH